MSAKLQARILETFRALAVYLSYASSRIRDNSKFMRRHALGLALVFAVLVVLTGCATERHSATVGNYKVVYGQMGPAAQRWETVKAAIAGWEVVGETDDEECSVLVLHKDK
jgi:hypothetical protein